VSLYEARLQADLTTISLRVDAVGALVLANLREALEGLLTGDQQRSFRVGLHDKAINRETRAIDALCHEFVARHFPAAGHLRFVSSVLRLDVALERIGDYGVNVARRAVLLTQTPKERNLQVVRAVGETAIELMHEAMAVWSKRDAPAARALIKRSRTFTKTHERTLDDLLVATEDTDLETLFVLRDAIFNFIRVGAQARNVCEETVFTVTGQGKEPKVYKVLFVGRENHRLTQIAEAYARKTFPQSGAYSSAGWAPADALHADVLTLAGTAGLDVSEAKISPLSAELPRLERFQVIVALEPGALEHLGSIPYSTVFLEWSFPQTEPTELLRAIAHEVRELMVALRGPDAS
jgi:phosphate transport system protein